jgi:Pectate lyase superfamily protein/Right handed beta helix region
MSIATHFGATGDGITDDTEALQHAIDDGDGVLELPKGTYRITKPLILDTTKRGYMGIRGSQGTARLVMAGPGPAIKVVGDHQGTASPERIEPHTWESERFPVLSGFEILGEHPEADGIQLSRVMQPVVRCMLIRRCRHGIHLVDRARNVIIADCQIYDCHDSGIFMDHVNLHQFNIIGNHISYCKRGGIRQLNGDLHNVQITGNDIEYNSGFDGMSGEILLEARESGLISEYTIVSNTIQAKPDAQGANIVIAGRDDKTDIPARVIAITGNVIGSRDRNILVEYAGRALTITGNVIYSGIASDVHLRWCHNATIGSNTIIPMKRLSYNQLGLGGVLLEDCEECVITGNTINDHDYGEAERGGSLTLLRCQDITVASCQILSPMHRGLFAEDCTRCMISGNSVIDKREEPSMAAAIEVVGDSKDNVIQNNLVAKGARGGIVCDEAAGVVSNNTELGT